MKCPKCNNIILLDEITEQYYCEECGKLYDSEDLDNRVTVPVLFMSFLMWIPILNFILMKVIEKSSSEHKKSYYNIFLSSLLFQMVLMCAGAFTYKWYRDTELKFARQTLGEATKIIFDTKDNNGVPEFQYTEIIDIRENIEKHKQLIADEETKKKSTYTEELIGVLEGANVSGEHLRYLIERYPDYAYFIQTKSIRSKNQNINIYFNVGRYVRESETQESGTRLIDCSLFDRFTLLYQSADYDVLDEQRTIYYIYNTEMFRVNFIYNKQDEIIGMSFTELEV